jgi:hypothetical protein
MDAGNVQHASIILVVLCFLSANAQADEPRTAESLWRKLEPHTMPPAEFAGQLGPYWTPLKFADGSQVKTPEDWVRRREEILKTWHQRLTVACPRGTTGGETLGNGFQPRRLRPASRPRSDLAGG